MSIRDPKRPVCDFCMGFNPKHSYDPTPDTGVEVIATLNGPLVADTTSTAWAACDTCAPLVDAAREDASKIEALVDHATRVGLHNMGVPSSVSDLRRYAVAVRKQYKRIVPGLSARRAPTDEEMDSVGDATFSRGPLPKT